MIKVCSLDFLYKDVFETDIMDSDGKIIFSSEDSVVPEKILKLYFKDIYIEKPLPVEHKAKIIEEAPEEVEEELIEQISQIEEPVADEIEEVEEPEEVKEEELLQEEVLVEEIEEELPLEEPIPEVISEITDEFLEFDEQQAARVSNYCKRLGQILKLSDSKLEELTQAAYYHRIGVTKFTKEDLSKKDFNKQQANAGFEILLNEKNMPHKIAEAVKFCVNNYNVTSFNLGDEIPYAHIIAVVSYYDNCVELNKEAKIATLDKMLQFGGNKFNIFVLHKFIKMMRDINE